MGMKSRKAALRSYIAPLIENRTVELKAQADGNEAGTLPKNPVCSISRELASKDIQSS